MIHPSHFESGVDIRRPFDTIVHSHAGLLPALGRLQQLADGPGTGRAGQAAREIVQTIDQLIWPHHEDEESELFPAVQAAARPGRQRALAQRLADRLIGEHCDIERLWTRLRPQLKQVGRAPACRYEVDVVQALARSYRDHVAFEEERYLPFAQRVLGHRDDHLAAFGVALHLRHLPAIPAYI